MPTKKTYYYSIVSSNSRKYGGQNVSKAMNDLSGQAKEAKKPSLFIRAWEMARFIFLNWILQNPLTDMANIGGNTSNLGFHITANIGNLGGVKTLARGIKKGFKEGARDAVQVLHGEREAISKFTEGSQVEVPTLPARSKKNLFRCSSKS